MTHNGGPPAGAVGPGRSLKGPLILAYLFLFAGGGLVLWQGLAHAARVGLSLLSVYLGLAGPRGTLPRSILFSAGLVLGAAAWWFVPVGGVNLWEASSRLSRLRALPLGEIDRYAAVEPGLEEVVEHFPALHDRVRRAEEDWLQRTMAPVVAEADAARNDDPDQASAALRDLAGRLEGLARFDDVVRPEMKAARARVMESRLNLARVQTVELLRTRGYLAVEAFGDKLARELGPEAAEVGMTEPLQDFRHTCKVFGDLGRLKGRKGPP